MYLEHYGFHEKPFDISTDPKFLWLGEKHKEAYAVLKYGVVENKGFLLLTGDVGAGKTTLINALLNSLGEDVICAFIPDPGLETKEFYRYLANAFGCDETFRDKAEFIFTFRDFLHVAHENGKTVLLIIDEAQRLTNDLLEEIRMLSNIELQDSKLLNIFFVGQAEFNTKLLDPDNRPVRQRITISNHIQPLSEKETGDYIRHRLKVAGSQLNIFSYVAIHEIYKYSGGYPRLINIVCDIALLTAYVRDKKKIGEDIVRESVESLNIESHQDSSKNDEIREGLEKALKANPSATPPLHQVTKLPMVAAKRQSNRWLWAGGLLFLGVMFGLGLAYYYHKDSSRKFFTDHGLSFMVGSAGQRSPVVSEEKGLKDQQMVLPYMTGRETEGASPDSDKGIDPQPTLDVNSRIILDFDYNSNDFSDESYRKMEGIASSIHDKSGYTVVVSGYTDNLGNTSYNDHLSLFRANSVKSFLVGQGVDKARIKTLGMGARNPLASNETAEGREKNRRVEIEIVPIGR